MPIKTWVVGEEVLAADFNTYVQTQVVARFATVAARDAAWPAATAGPGAMSVTADTDTLWMVRGVTWQQVSSGSTGWVSYTPVWSSTGGGTPPAVGNGTLTGAYCLNSGICDIAIRLVVGTTGTTGGTLGLGFSLPFPGAAAFAEQWLNCKTFLPTPGGNYLGSAVVVGGSSTIQPFFPASTVDAPQNVDQWRAADAANNPATGIPKVVGGYSVQINQNLIINGRYRVT